MTLCTNKRFEYTATGAQTAETGLRCFYCSTTGKPVPTSSAIVIIVCLESSTFYAEWNCLFEWCRLTQFFFLQRCTSIIVVAERYTLSCGDEAPLLYYDVSLCNTFACPKMSTAFAANSTNLPSCLIANLNSYGYHLRRGE